jgi:hypothetical protein
LKTKGKVPWEPDISVKVEDIRTYYKSEFSSFGDESREELRFESLSFEESLDGDALTIEDYVFRPKSHELYKKALNGDIESGLKLAKFVADRVAKKLKLDSNEEAYYQHAMRGIADGEPYDEAFLSARKNGRKNVSHIPYRDQWILDKFCDQLNSGKKPSEAADSIYTIMVEFHLSAMAELTEAEASGIVERVEDAKRLLMINTPISPERIIDIYKIGKLNEENQIREHRTQKINYYLASRALRNKSK